MTPEAKLRNLIRAKYGSVRKFTQEHGLPYSTVATMFSRGIYNSSVSTLINVCNLLGISADELIAGRITFVEEQPKPKRIEDFVIHFKHQLQNTQNLTLNDKPVNDDTISSLVKSLDLLIEIEKNSQKG